ncbi:uncharacterized protein EI97DRAFT_457961 [Westerdykella ornata]|uniref:Uncharacterized protein n=1 Tax=Westerdykella ornata TaxID=318751 RepID=A0A6A6JLZ4_WESOR|nr:uncharacterized protein EI97DRAFT_457961 [Westerdykella ornata]KAF2277264.1 hypothetical protein EI97DRAFT_457961 [Westerdykella ornata]
MPPKEENGAAPLLLKGFDAKEQRLLAAAFIATTDNGKIDYGIMEELTGHTQGTLKKFWPPVKRKAADLHPSFAKAQGLVPESGTTGAEATTLTPAPGQAPVPKPGKKRKAAAAPAEAEDGEEKARRTKTAAKGKKYPAATNEEKEE